jgi:hypothetical protein
MRVLLVFAEFSVGAKPVVCGSSIEYDGGAVEDDEVGPLRMTIVESRMAVVEPRMMFGELRMMVGLLGCALLSYNLQTGILRHIRLHTTSSPAIKNNVFTGV